MFGVTTISGVVDGVTLKLSFSQLVSVTVVSATVANAIVAVKQLKKLLFFIFLKSIKTLIFNSS
jgi:hypothetical protein